MHTCTCARAYRHECAQVCVKVCVHACTRALPHACAHRACTEEGGSAFLCDLQDHTLLLVVLPALHQCPRQFHFACLLSFFIHKKSHLSSPPLPHCCHPGQGAPSADQPVDSVPSTSSGPSSSQPLVYACSWWNSGQAEQYLQDRSQPIWNSLSQGHVELYREVGAWVEAAA